VPLTPFHLGPALLVRAAGRGWFSLGVFALVQGLIDLEPVAHVALGRFPLHGSVHTPPGGLVAALVGALAGKPALSALYGALRPRLAARADVPRWLVAELRPITWRAAAGGALTGALSHLVLDALIHHDVRPLWPAVAGNPLLIAGSFGWVHGACAVMGLAGAVLLRARVVRAGADGL
jgi:hypothetical protein